MKEFEEELTIAIPDIHCKNCAKTIAITLKYLEGIMDSNVDFQAKNVKVRLNPSIINRKKVVRSLNYLGFKAYISIIS
ncbi:MAG: heavy-metal-associated domain-containing protein [Candidatus Heimdallarchaeum aukensis]|uniref:Heavy-metal-associated domain-containing protein n=1 Tax=Candidatus Heimdallarchaeum aukensis TaxID=2876573 RepID=A0A9Y1BM74_9ARCH|nr:MAG: heavy-metal-associated domain-containing protein [Candidatus Heimdallarchaeum aukensis]